jgi:MoaA/NifB/PqqE/SkfB family radical SAM enzyme
MKRFPFWLWAELLRGQLAQSLRGSAKQNLILRLDPADHGSVSGPPGNGNPPGIRTETDILGLVEASDAPVVWIGGSEPLRHSGIGGLARRVVDRGRTVFVETDGFHLRQRIHEFRPVSRLYLTLKFYGLQRSNDMRVRKDWVFRRAIEGIRAAKLSGFLICGHVLVDAETDLDEVKQLKEQLLGMDVDGLLVSAPPGGFRAENQEREIAERKLMEARKIVESRGWGAFGRLLERESREVWEREQSASERDRIPQPTNEQEEGVEV